MMCSINKLPTATQDMLMNTPAQLRAVLKHLGANVVAGTGTTPVQVAKTPVRAQGLEEKDTVVVVIRIAIALL